MAWPTTTIDTTAMDASTDDPSQARAEIEQMAENVNNIKDARGAASGVASLDATGKVPESELPTTGAHKGGTGQTAYTVGDILYASTPNTLTKLPAAQAGWVLTANGAGAAPSWQQASGGLNSGTRMAFNQTAAPTGWTKDTTYNDSLMRIVSGSVGSGGSEAFSDFNAINSTAAHTLTLSEIPPHTHTYLKSGANYAFSGVGIQGGANSTANTSSAGSGGAHSHGVLHDIKYNDFIVAQRD